jgi:hypothetical protein
VTVLDSTAEEPLARETTEVVAKAEAALGVEMVAVTRVVGLVGAVKMVMVAKEEEVMARGET